VKHSVAAFAGSVGLLNRVWENPPHRYIGNRYHCACCKSPGGLLSACTVPLAKLRHLCVNNRQDDCSSYYSLATYYDSERDKSHSRWRTRQ